MRNIIPILILFILTSCEGPRSKQGAVFDAVTKEPLDKVTIRFYGKESKTDSLGQFDISAFIGCTTKCNPFEAYFEKKGYETLYINFSNEFDKNEHGGQHVEIFLKPTTDKQPVFAQSNFSKGVLTYSKVMVLIGALTFFISLFLKVKFKLLWIVAILWGNLSLGYNVITTNFDLSIFDSFARGIAQYKWDIYFIPLGTIVYWVYYFGLYKRVTIKTSTKVG
jgi:hypothetical protein